MVIDGNFMRLGGIGRNRCPGGAGCRTAISEKPEETAKSGNFGWHRILAMSEN